MSRTSSRRAALAASTASPPPRAPRPTEHASSSDAVLLELCDRFHTTHAEAEATTTDAALEAAMGRRWDISGEIETTPAHTPSGKAAKARVALVVLQECADMPHPGSWERLVLVALAEAAGLPIPSAGEGAGAHRRGSAGMSTITPASVVAHMPAFVQAERDADAALLVLAERTVEHQRAEEAGRLAFIRCEAATNLILALPATTLADAAAQVMVAAFNVRRMREIEQDDDRMSEATELALHSALVPILAAAGLTLDSVAASYFLPFANLPGLVGEVRA